MEGESLKEKTAKGLLWGGLSNGLMQVLGAVFGLVLMNTLTPDDYGKVAMLNIFAALAAALQESGFVAALCNKKEPTHEEYNAVFWMNLLVSATLYVLLWLAAPFMARFYHDPDLTSLARVLFLGFLFSGLGTAQRAYLFGHLMVRQSSLCSMLGMLGSGIIGVSMALCGFAYWSIVAQAISFVLIVQVLSWHFSPWRPTWNFDLRPAWKMFGFSSKLMLTNIFNIFNNHAFSVLLGRFFNAHVAGVYTQARKWDDMAAGTINTMVTGVAQPTLSQVNDDVARYRQVFRKMLRFICFITFPTMLGLGLIAREFILIAGGEKWAESGLILSVLCVHGAFVPITTLYSNLAISRGKSGVNMACTIGQCLVVWAGLYLLYPYGMMVMVIFFVLLNIAWLVVWQWWAKRLIGLSWQHALADTLPFLCFTVAVLALTGWSTQGISHLWWLLVTRILLAGTLYGGVMWLSGARIMRESIRFLRRK